MSREGIDSLNASRPNILWICTDQQRSDTIGALGNAHIRTPNIDRLVGTGLSFTRADCQSPICTPSRASFLTGMYPSSVHGCMNGNQRWADAAPLVTRILADTGYDCGLAGKLHLAGAAERIEPRPDDDGYRVFHWSHDPCDLWPSGHAYRDRLQAKGFDLGELNKDLTQIPPELHQTTWCADMAIKFMREERDQPWLMSVNMFDPHAPFDPPQEYLAHYDPDTLPGSLFRDSDLPAQERLSGIDFQNPARHPDEFGAGDIIAAYYAMIELIDHNVGRLLTALDETGQTENTVVIFMSDHGEMLGDHGLLLKGCRFYEGLVRVPLILSWPGKFKEGAVSDALVELTDIAPTLLEATGQTPPKQMQGRSLLQILTGKANPHEHRAFVRCEYYSALNPDVAGRQRFTGTYATMIRNRRYKLVKYHGHPLGELFDLEEDPHEFDNRWNDSSLSDVRLALLEQSFDALAFAVDVGPQQVMAF